MLLLCLILILFLPPSLINCDHKRKPGKASTRGAPNIVATASHGSRSNRSDSTVKDSRRGKKKLNTKVGGGSKTRSINVAMHDDRFPITSPSPLKSVFISSSNHPTPKKEKLGEKELAILHGARCRNTDYPTMADIESDWDDKKDGDPRGVRTAEENNEQTAHSGTKHSEKTDKE